MTNKPQYMVPGSTMLKPNADISHFEKNMSTHTHTHCTITENKMSFNTANRLNETVVW